MTTRNTTRQNIGSGWKKLGGELAGMFAYPCQNSGRDHGRAFQQHRACYLHVLIGRDSARVRSDSLQELQDIYVTSAHAVLLRMLYVIIVLLSRLVKRMCMVATPSPLQKKNAKNEKKTHPPTPPHTSKRTARHRPHQRNRVRRLYSMLIVHPADSVSLLVLNISC